MNRSRIGRRDLLSAGVLALSGLSAVPGHAQVKPEKVRVVVAIGARASLSALPLTIADRLGYFGAEGLDVELHESGGGSRADPFGQDGPGDMVAGAFDNILHLQGRNQFFRAFVLLGRAPQVALGVSNKTMPTYKALGELKGRRIGVAKAETLSMTVARLLLVRAGIKPEDVHFVELPSAAAAVTAVRSGQVDAVCHTEPVMTLLEHKAEVRIIVDTRSLKGTQDLFGGPVVASCIYATADYVQKHPNTVQGVTNAIVHALKWHQTAGPSDIIKVVPEAYLLGDRGLYLAAFNKVREVISADGMIPEEGVRTVHRTMARLDAASASDRIDLAKTFTNEFARKAKDKFRA